MQLTLLIIMTGESRGRALFSCYLLSSLTAIKRSLNLTTQGSSKLPQWGLCDISEANWARLTMKFNEQLLSGVHVSFLKLVIPMEYQTDIDTILWTVSFLIKTSLKATCGKCASYLSGLGKIYFLMSWLSVEHILYMHSLQEPQLCCC